MLERKYDVETALVIEQSVTDCVMQQAEVLAEVNDLKDIIEQF